MTRTWPIIALVAACLIAGAWTAPDIHYSGSLLLTGVILLFTYGLAELVRVER